MNLVSVTGGPVGLRTCFRRPTPAKGQIAGWSPGTVIAERELSSVGSKSTFSTRFRRASANQPCSRSKASGRPVPLDGPRLSCDCFEPTDPVGGTPFGVGFPMPVLYRACVCLRSNLVGSLGRPVDPQRSRVLSGRDGRAGPGPGRGVTMSFCSYVYDANGLRWRDGSLTVHLVVNGELRTLAVVRSGQGTSRLDRFEATPHPVDVVGEKVFGEISVRDLERLAAGSKVSVVTSGRRFTLGLPGSGTSAPDGVLEAFAYHEEDGFLHRFAVPFAPGRSQGESGRSLDDPRRVAGLASFVVAQSPERLEVLMRAQVEAMPKSGRAGGPASRRRLRFLAGEVSPSVFLDAVGKNPDALLHVTPGLLADLVARCDSNGDDAGRRMLASFVDAHAAAVPSEGGNVVLASMFALEASGRSVVGSAFSAAVSRPRMVEVLAAEVRALGSGSLALEVLATADRSVAAPGSGGDPREAAVSVLRRALVDGPLQVLSPTMAIFLTRMHGQGAPELLDYLVETHPAQIVSTPDFFEMLPAAVCLSVLRREPRLALAGLELDRASEVVAEDELRRRGEPVPPRRSEIQARQRLGQVEAMRAEAGVVLRDLAEFEGAFTDRLRRLRTAGLSALERDRLVAFGGLRASTQDFFWPTLRRVQDLVSRAEMLALEVKTPPSGRYAGPDVDAMIILEGLDEAMFALRELHSSLKVSMDRLEALRQLGRDNAVEDFCGEYERAFADVPVVVHRFVGVFLNALPASSAT
jgi:hypothetical protein